MDSIPNPTVTFQRMERAQRQQQFSARSECTKKTGVTPEQYSQMDSMGRGMLDQTIEMCAQNKMYGAREEAIKKRAEEGRPPLDDMIKNLMES